MHRPYDARIWRSLALVYEKLERLVDAIFCYEQAIDADGSTAHGSRLAPPRRGGGGGADRWDEDDARLRVVSRTARRGIAIASAFHSRLLAHGSAIRKDAAYVWGCTGVRGVRRRDGTRRGNNAPVHPLVVRAKRLHRQDAARVDGRRGRPGGRGAARDMYLAALGWHLDDGYGLGVRRSTAIWRRRASTLAASTFCTETLSVLGGTSSAPSRPPPPGYLSIAPRKVGTARHTDD